MKRKVEGKENKILAEIKRHNEMLMEHMKQQVNIVAEQHGYVINKLDEHSGEFTKINSRLDNVEIGLKGVKSELKGVKSELNTVKIAVLENTEDIKELKIGQKELKTNQERMEQKLDTKLIDHETRIEKIEEIVYQR